jgi:hypothetical protein
MQIRPTPELQTHAWAVRDWLLLEVQQTGIFCALLSIWRCKQTQLSKLCVTVSPGRLAAFKTLDTLREMNPLHWRSVTAAMRVMELRIFPLLHLDLLSVLLRGNERGVSEEGKHLRVSWHLTASVRCLRSSLMWRADWDGACEIHIQTAGLEFAYSSSRPDSTAPVGHQPAVVLP